MKARFQGKVNALRRRHYWIAKGGYKDVPKADIAMFLWMIANYQAAAQLRTPTENPAQKKLTVDDDVLTFPDNAMNRGLFAISKEAKELNLDPGIFMERFMGQVDVTRWNSVWRMGACRRGIEGQTELSEAFIYALAQSRYRGGFKHRGFDRGDVIRNMKNFASGNLNLAVYTVFDESLSK